MTLSAILRCKMKYVDKYNKLRGELWEQFQLLVRSGATLPTLVSTVYPKGINPDGLSIDTDGQSWFYAKEIIKDDNYNLNLGEDIIVGIQKVKFKDIDNRVHEITPDNLDLYWLCEILDAKVIE